jgi:N-acetylglucosaminyl-diphospho-decaprenol L-rhamnosyltransferase
MVSDVSVHVRDNLGEVILKDYCEEIGVQYSQSPARLGFGANNNSLFHSISCCHDDYLIILNPDVKIEGATIDKLSDVSKNLKDFLISIELRDPKKGRLDENSGDFPTILSLLSSYFLKRRKFFKGKTFLARNEVDWCSGSFMFMPVSVFVALGGFDERYFMYMEDVDFCRKYFKIYRQKVLLLRNVFGEHEAQRANRIFLSRAFFWHVFSIIKYFVKWGF